MYINQLQLEQLSAELQAQHLSYIYNDKFALRFINFSKIKTDAYLILIQEDNLQGNKITQAGGSINEIFRLICSDKKHYENFINLILEKISDDYFDMNTLEIQIPDFYTILKYLIKTEIIEKLAKNKELLDISKITKHSFKPFSKSLKHAFNSSSFYFSEANDTVTQQELDNWTEVEIKTIGKEFVLDIEKIANEIKKQKEEKESSSESQSQTSLNYHVFPEIYDEELGRLQVHNFGQVFDFGNGNGNRAQEENQQNDDLPMKDVDLSQFNSKFGVIQYGFREFRFFDRCEFQNKRFSAEMEEAAIGRRKNYNVKFGQVKLKRGELNNTVDVKQVRGKIESDMDPFSLDLIRKGMIILKDRRDIESHNSFFDERDINQAKDVTMVKLGRGFVTQNIYTPGRNLLDGDYTKKGQERIGFGRNNFIDTQNEKLGNLVNYIADSRSKKILIKFQPLSNTAELLRFNDENGIRGDHTKSSKQLLEHLNPALSFLPTKFKEECPLGYETMELRNFRKCSFSYSMQNLFSPENLVAYYTARDRVVKDRSQLVSSFGCYKGHSNPFVTMDAVDRNLISKNPVGLTVQMMLNLTRRKVELIGLYNEVDRSTMYNNQTSSAVSRLQILNQGKIFKNFGGILQNGVDMA